MAVMDDVNKALAEAMKARDRIRLDALRMLKTALVNRSVEKSHDLDDQESLQVVASLIKQRRDSIEQFTAGGRQDLADKELAEIGVLQAYMPEPLGPAEVDRVVGEVIEETGARSPKDFGRVMKAVMGRLAGQGADGKLVSEAVRRRLNG